mmetsp:Transcript_37214/g.112526  ORF Transcript_37214/g.112526 Transcript_37214/m.112526 type:complete len:217 (-) Transcript_37214:733-1383(-)
MTTCDTVGSSMPLLTASDVTRNLNLPFRNWSTLQRRDSRRLPGWTQPTFIFSAAIFLAKFSASGPCDTNMRTWLPFSVLSIARRCSTSLRSFSGTCCSAFADWSYTTSSWSKAKAADALASALESALASASAPAFSSGLPAGLHSALPSSLPSALPPDGTTPSGGKLLVMCTTRAPPLWRQTARTSSSNFDDHAAENNSTCRSGWTRPDRDITSPR